MHNRNTRSAVPQEPALNTASSGSRRVGLPTLCCMILATVSFGAARIHAGNIAPTAEATANKMSILTRFVDFKPNAYAPAAYADWVEPAEK